MVNDEWWIIQKYGGVFKKYFLLVFLCILTNLVSFEKVNNDNFNIYIVFDNETDVDFTTHLRLNIKSKETEQKKFLILNFTENQNIYSITQNRNKFFKTYKISKYIQELDNLNLENDSLIIICEYDNIIPKPNTELLYFVKNKVRVKQKLNSVNDIFIDCTFNNLDSNSIQIISKKDLDNCR